LLYFIKKEVVLIQFFAPLTSIRGFIFSTVERKNRPVQKLVQGERRRFELLNNTALWFRPMGKCPSFAEKFGWDFVLNIWCRQFLSWCGAWFLNLTTSSLSFTASNSILAVLKTREEKKKKAKEIHHICLV